MPYEFLDHEADIGIRSTGDTLEEAFEDGAKAMFAVMVDLETVESHQKIEIEVGATDIAALFIEWLNELLAQSDIEGIIFSKFENLAESPISPTLLFIESVRKLDFNSLFLSLCKYMNSKKY